MNPSLPTAIGGSTEARALESRLTQMADEDEYWDNDDLAATHRAIAATLGSQRALIAELLEALGDTLSLARLKWGNLDPSANIVFDHASAVLTKARGQ